MKCTNLYWNGMKCTVNESKMEWINATEAELSQLYTPYDKCVLLILFLSMNYRVIYYGSLSSG